ncbi:MAG: HAD family phosphatase [Acidobacteria bacterium]|nr:HAD family phosphatase [Acidobacteriota bacterium]
MILRGLIFDFNGVIVNDEPVHCSAFQRALSTLHLSLTHQDYFDRYLPYDDENFFRQFAKDRGLAFTDEQLKRLVDCKSQAYFEFIRSDVPVIEPTVDFIRRLPAQFLLAIASAAARAEIELILRRLHLLDRFQGVVAAGEVKKGKPHPESFLASFELLRRRDPQLSIKQVAVIEDSDRGVQSAQAAGMKCVAITSSYPAAKLSRADLVIESLAGWTLSRLEEELG